MYSLLYQSVQSTVSECTVHCIRVYSLLYVLISLLFFLLHDKVLFTFCQEYLYIPNLENVDGLAFDWIYKNLYWTDATTNTVNMASKIGKNDTWLSRELYRNSKPSCESIFSNHNVTDVCIQEPRSIVVEPLKVM